VTGLGIVLVVRGIAVFVHHHDTREPGEHGDLLRWKLSFGGCQIVLDGHRFVLRNSNFEEGAYQFTHPLMAFADGCFDQK
jgi:hypothetical protein